MVYDDAAEDYQPPTPDELKQQVLAVLPYGIAALLSMLIPVFLFWK